MGLLSLIPGVGDLIDSIGKSVDELVTSDEERGQIEVEKGKVGVERNKVDLEKKRVELQQMIVELKSQHKQLEINMVQARHPSLFVAGARPAIIWIGAVGLLYEAILRPICTFIATRIGHSMMTAQDVAGMIGINADTSDPAVQKLMIQAYENYMRFYEFPHIDENLFMPIILGVLGIGGFRTYEKIQNKAKDNMHGSSAEFEALASSALTRFKKEAADLKKITSNRSMEEFHQATKVSGFKPYFPSEDEVLK